MYLHIGDDVVVPLADLVAIIDAKSMEQSTTNRSHLQKAVETGTLVDVNAAQAQAWIITKNKVYASPTSSLTLKKRARFLGDCEVSSLDAKSALPCLGSVRKTHTKQ